VPRVALDAPDLLVYRAPTDTASMDDTEQLPSGARLLGAASPTDSTSFPWTPGPCVLVLYSLGHSRRFDTVQVRDAGAGASPTQERR
jgi:hypothetical protein